MTGDDARLVADCLEQWGDEGFSVDDAKLARVDQIMAELREYARTYDEVAAEMEAERGAERQDA